MIDAHIPVSEYISRRDKVLKGLGGAVGVVFAGEGGPPLSGRWLPHYHFYYLTGIRAEQGAAILFDPKHEDPTRRCVLFLRPANPEMEQWDGRREPLGQHLRDTTGFTRIMRTGALDNFLTQAIRRTKRAACLHPASLPSQPVPPDLAKFRQIAERVVGVSIEDRTGLVPHLRSVKSRAEQTLMKRALEITKHGYEALIGVMEPGASERDLHNALVAAFRAGGSEGPAYNPIIGAGLNATVLHYMDNTAPIADGDLICLDAGAEFGGYAADITRSLPANGTFSKRQREIYEIVLRAQEASIRACKPGASMHEVDKAGRDIIEKAGFGDAYIHGVGHHLGLEVHDVTPDGKLEPGQIVTIEPGIYLPDEQIGVRIEDDILITPGGRTNLSRDIPKHPDEVEAWIRAVRKGGKSPVPARNAPKKPAKKTAPRARK
ncbi:MAG: aminopeptidase P N-terminal domain-containing protein [Phycisphaerales bacterium JB037]